MPYASHMDGLFGGLAEDVIEWVDDRYGRTAAWVVGIFAVLALTVGALAIAVAALAYFGG